MKTCPKCFQENLDDSRFCKHCGTSLAAVEGEKAGDPLVGKTIAGNFAVKRKLAVGGMGSIYEAEQVSLQKRVCIKVLHKHLLRDNTIIKRFHREARAASKLKHANCINVIDFGQADNGVLYLAMDFVEGKDLADTIEKGYPLGTERVLRIMKQVAAALDEAHANGIIHRDLKPENIMVEQRRQAADHVIVLDFGIAKIKEPGREDRETFQTMAGVVCGTPEYMSPEQIRGEELDARTDIYSMGVIMWQMFTNRLPFVGATPIATVTKHLTERPEAPSKYCPDLPAPVEAYIIKMMSKNRADRPATALEIKERLEEFEAAIKNRGAQPARPSVYDPDLDATMIDVRPGQISDEQRQAIASMSLPDDAAATRAQRPVPAAQPAPRPAGQPQPAPAMQARPGQPAVAATLRPEQRPAQPGAQPQYGAQQQPGQAQRSAQAAARPQAQSQGQRAIHDPLQRSVSSLGTSVEDGPDDDLRPPSSRKGMVIAIVAVLAVLAAGAAYFVFGSRPAPAVSEADATTQAPAATGADVAERDVTPAPDSRPATRADAAPATPPAPAAEAAPSAPAASAEAAPATPAPGAQTAADKAGEKIDEKPETIVPGRAGQPPLRVVSLSPSEPAKAPAKKAGDAPAAAGGKGKDYEKMGDKAFASGNYAEAKAYFNLALKYDGNASLHKKIGYCYKNLGRLDDARSSFRSYLAALPADKRATEEQILKGQGLL